MKIIQAGDADQVRTRKVALLFPLFLLLLPFFSFFHLLKLTLLFQCVLLAARLRLSRFRLPMPHYGYLFLVSRSPSPGSLPFSIL